MLTIQGVLTLTPEVVEELRAKLKHPGWVSIVDKRQSASRLVDVNKVDGPCWLWQGATAGGYPILEVKGKNIIVRRLSYLLFVSMKDIENCSVFSTCRNQMCISPKHLRLRYKRKGGRKVKRKIPVPGSKMAGG